MRRQTLVLNTPMHELIRLIEKIDTVLKEYLRQRFGVTSVILNEQPIENILLRLSKNTLYYRHLTAQATAAPNPSTFNLVTNALVSGAHFIDNTVRYYTNTDGGYRIDTLSWLCWSLRYFQQCLCEYEQFTATTDPKILQSKLAKETKAFFDALTRILEHTLPDVKSVFKLSRQGIIYRIYGLKNDPSELGRLLRVHLQEEFNSQILIEKMTEDIMRHSASLAKEQRARMVEKQQYEASIEKLEKSNADLLRQLENIHNSVRQLQSELQQSRERTDALDSELRIKVFQENTFERRIDKLEKEKKLLEQKQAQSNNNAKSVQYLQQEIDDMRLALADAERKKEEVANERMALLSQVQNEQQRQELLQKQITVAHDENNTLADELQQPEAIIIESPHTDELEEDDEIDVGRLSETLRQFNQQHYSNTISASPPMHQESITKKIPFPHYEEEAFNGLTSAQVHVIEGKTKHLHALLKRDPEIVNTICDVKGSDQLGKKSLTELAIFHSKAAYKQKKETLELILKYRPNITAANPSVLYEMINRIASEGCNNELRDIFCQYAIAQKTCSKEAREEMKIMLLEIERGYSILHETPCKILLKELQTPLNICRALEQGYINGSFSKIDPIVLNEKAIDNVSAYEIIFDLEQKLEAEEKYKRKFGTPLLLRRMVDSLSNSIRICHSLMPGRRVVAKTSPNDVVPANSEINNDFNIEQLRQYSELVNNITRIIERYGVVLNAKGFNSYQRSEIAFMIQSEEPDAAPQFAHDDPSSTHLVKQITTTIPYK